MIGAGLRRSADVAVALLSVHIGTIDGGSGGGGGDGSGAAVGGRR